MDSEWWGKKAETRVVTLTVRTGGKSKIVKVIPFSSPFFLHSSLFYCIAAVLPMCVSDTNTVSCNDMMLELWRGRKTLHSGERGREDCPKGDSSRQRIHVEGTCRSRYSCPEAQRTLRFLHVESLEGSGSPTGIGLEEKCRTCRS